MYDSSTYVLFADITATVHLLYVLFVVLGQLYIMIGWLFFWPLTRNLWFRLIHLVMILIVAVQELMQVRCPLTVLEHRLRYLGGQTISTDLTFLMRLFHRVVFIDVPMWMYTFLYVGFGALVLLTIVVMPPRLKKLKKRNDLQHSTLI